MKTRQIVYRSFAFFLITLIALAGLQRFAAPLGLANEEVSRSGAVNNLMAPTPAPERNVFPPPPDPSPPNTPPLPPNSRQPGKIASDCEDIIQNGSFEDDTYWSANPFDNVVYTATVSTDDNNARLVYLSTYGGVDVSVWQALDIPDDAESVAIQFSTSPLLDAGEAAYLIIWDDDFTTQLYTRLLEHSVSGWNEFNFTLPAADIKGKTVNVTFQVAKDGDSGYSYLYLDKVSLEVCTPSPAPPVNEVPVGAENDGGQVALDPGEYLTVNLEANPSTGYLWEVSPETMRAQNGSPVLRLSDEIVFQEQTSPVRSTSDEDLPIVGAPVTQTMRFDPLQTGGVTLTLVYRGAATETGRAPVIDTYSIQVQSNGNTEAAAPVTLEDSYPPLETPASTDTLRIPGDDSVGLPSHFNWCDSANGGCTPVKNQRSCGSCWAFATAGAFENVIKIRDNATKDLSEQYLVSCNSNGYGCKGGWWVHDMHKSPKSAIYEATFPYTARDDSCKSGLTYNQEKISNWGYVSSSGVPSVSALKQAIHEHGSISVAVCVGSAFSSYRGGIFRTDEKSACGGSVNHGVVLTGWDDSQRVFYMRNSWGSNWGESGYMRIGYGISNIGYRASYVIYNESSGTRPDAPASLRSTVSGNNIILRWTDRSDNETGFKIKRWNGSSWQQIATVGANATTYTDKSAKCGTSYYYKVWSYNGEGDSTSPSNMVRATTGSCGQFNAPTNLVAVGDSNGVSLRWRDNSNSETAFLIARWDGSKWTWLPTMAANTTSYTDRGATPSKYRLYYYIAIARGSQGYSGWSNFSKVLTPPSAQLSAPAGATASSPLKSYMTLSWSDDGNQEVDGYTIERWSGSEWEKIGETASKNYTDSGLSCDTDYAYMIYASNAYNNSNFSNMAEGTTRGCDTEEYSVYLPLTLK